MTSMRQTVSTVSTTRSANSENHLDALLDDLQSTISRTGSLRGVNGSMSGYREVRRTVRDDATGENSTEYSIEYLHPANSTTHVRELSSPDAGYGTGLSSHREVSKYNTTSSTSSLRKSGERDERLKHSITELDNILDDLHRPRTYHHAYNQQLALTNSPSAIESGPFDMGNRMEERHFHEERREVRGPRRELVFTGPKSRDPSPSSAIAFPTSPGYDRPALRQEVYRYEKTTTSKTIAPDGTVIYHDGDGGRKNLDEVRTVRSPSPQYLQYRDPSPGRLIDASPGYGKTNQSYSYSSSHESRSNTKTPPPHRSPSPVSFNTPPNPPTPPVTVRTSRNTTTSYDQNYHTSVPQPKFTPIDTSYKVTTKTTSTSNKYSDNKPRPFPNPNTPPLAGDQHPPKRLDDLMATFDGQDNMREVNEYTTRTETTRKTTSSDSGHHVVHVPIEKERAEDKKSSLKKTEVKEETKNISGPPVYYPKGELFSKKEESQTQSQSASGGGKYKAKRNYKYESGSKYKESSDTKVVPVCVPCPCCCAAPCTIM